MLKTFAIALMVATTLACTEGRAPPPAETAGAASAASSAGVEANLATQEDAGSTLPARDRVLLDDALARVAPSRADVPEFFFVGLAGWAGEDVFLNEARAAADLFRRRFGAEGRTLLLVNNPETAGELPPATVAALETALRGIAAKMDSEDVLFLYLTSHGNRGRFHLRQDEADLPDLRAGQLRRMLDAAGVKNRVVAISACYSGSFIEPLRDPNTLVMTAAAADRPSFGCGHDGPFTYFGRALIGEALEAETSFIRAFAEARRAIEAREREEGLKPSRPQIFVGDAIEPALGRIQRRLQDGRVGP